MKFLVIRFSSIGDIVLTSPVVRCIKKQIPEAEVHFLTKGSFQMVTESNPYIDKFFYYNNDINDVIVDLKEQQYDYIIDLHKNARSLRIKKALNHVKAFSFNKLNIEKWLLTALKINVLPQKHIVDREFDELTHFGIINDGKGLDYFIPDKSIVKETDLPASHVHGYIGIVIGAAHFTKQLPVEKLKELCSKIQHPIILLGGKEDQQNGEAIASVDTIKIYNACGKFTLNESADIVRKSKMIISHDTGLMHIAAAFKKSIISIWGNTIPQFGMYPYYGNAIVKNKAFEVKKLFCRPCSKIGYKKCPKKHFKCMLQQDIDSIAETVKSWLNGN